MDPVGFDILFEESGLLVVRKPSGVLTQAPPGIDSLETRVKRHIKSRDDKPGNVYLGVPHRLDRPVSGVMVLAKNSKTARRLSEQFEARAIGKTYWAVVEGAPAEESGTWTDYLR
ncbi:MAG: 23S rRNA pseudouridine1911/1915/1917 synthase, partial [Pirellulaceae bacterium]